MNFFEHQDSARRSTRRLVVLFCLAVFFLIVLTNLAIIGGLWFFDSSIFQTHQSVVEGNPQVPFAGNFLESIAPFFDLKRVGLVSLSLIAVIAIVILSKRSELSGGGQVIAKRLGGKLISPDSTEANERVILNVVEEMALASGTAVPPVYLLPESGINAFAAGFNPSDAVIGISEGAINNLNRDQLQGLY